ncbi:MAG TPA: SdrD B-like domain-containing protein [Verrucomicrobiales bacterium]|nr:SdrD B-like domain-containing protein [Verrucomicrobiales bacterium]
MKRIHQKLNRSFFKRFLCRAGYFSCALLSLAAPAASFAADGTGVMGADAWHTPGTDAGEFYYRPTSGPVTNADYSALTKNQGAVAGVGSFQTFCLERSEGIRSPSDYTINDEALNGGTNNTPPAGDQGGDVISQGTAWLYSEFAQGTLPGYDFTNAGPNRTTQAELLQFAIWVLEDELGAPAGAGNPFYQAALLHGGKANASPGLHGVYVINNIGNAPLQLGQLGQDCLYFKKANAPTAELGDFVWVDCNENGIQDATEVGLNGVTVKLLDGGGNVLNSTVTANLGPNPGYYLFTGLTPGVPYKVQFVAPCEYVFTAPGLGGDAAKDSNANPADGITAAVVLAADESNLTIDAGLKYVAPLFANVPLDAIYQCIGDVPPPADVTAKDNCGNPVGVTFGEVQTAPGSSCQNKITRTWSALTPCGNTVSVSQTITVNDTTKPEVTGVPAGGDLGCNPTTLPTDASVKDLSSAKDNCDATPDINVSHVDSPAGCFVVRVFTITAKDDCGNESEAKSATYRWKIDLLAPVITGTPGDKDLGCNPAGVPDDGDIKLLVTAEDNCDTDILINVTHVDAGDDCAKSRTFTITAKDLCDNVSEAKTVIYRWRVDMIKPVVTGVPAGGDLGCNPTSLPTDAGVKGSSTAEDNCDAAPEITVSHVDGGTDCLKTRTFSITAKDSCDNVSDAKSVTYTWKADTTAPELSGVPAGSDLGCNPGTLPTDGSVKGLVSANDNCDANPVITVTHVDGGTDCAKTRTFTITAKDSCDNVSPAKSVVYTWKEDTAKPVLKGVPGGGDLGCKPATVPTEASVKAQVTAEDNCDSNPVITVTKTDSGSDCAKTRTFTISAKDACGNVSDTKTVTYTWKADSTPPEITCPPNICIPYTDSKPPTFCGYTQGGWGAPPCGYNVGSLLKNNFAAVYPSGVEVGIPGGAGFSMKFTSAKAIENYLPAGGTAKALTADATNPTTSASGVFGGQVLALQLNVDFNKAGVIKGSGPIGGLVLNYPGSPLHGKTIDQILALAEIALGGGNAGVSFSDLNSMITKINEAFDNCKCSDWAEDHLLPTPEPPNTTPGKTGYATATDNCGNPAVTFTDVISAANCPDGYIITRTWKATDGCNNTDTCIQKIYVGCKDEQLNLVCPAVDNGVVGLPFSSALVATGGTAPYTFSIISGALPNGLTLNTSSGAITGTPTVAGSFGFTAKVKDSTGGTAFTDTVNCCIIIKPKQTSGCTLTIGYYKNHPSAITPLPINLGTSGGAKTFVVSSTAIGVNVLGQHTYGSPSNGITKLYAQLLAAKLNGLRGASLSAVSSTISSADAFLATHNYLDWSVLSSSEQTSVGAWHSALDNYNNGVTGPGHCGDRECSRPLTPVCTPSSYKCTISWKSCVDAKNYKVLRSCYSNGPFYCIENTTSNSCIDDEVENGKCYYYRIISCKDNADDNDSDDVCSIPSTSLPSPWQSKDIGCVVATGSANGSGSSFTLNGSGADIWDYNDAFRYMYQTASGDCSIVAKVNSVENTDPWSKAGVMIRESLNTNARHASVFVTPSNGVAWQWRSSTGGSSGNVNTTGLSAPYWVKIVRSGSTFSAYRSSTGASGSWVLMGSQTISMGSTVYIGLAVTSHDEGNICTSSFQNVTAVP